MGENSSKELPKTCFLKGCEIDKLSRRQVDSIMQYYSTDNNALSRQEAKLFIQEWCASLQLSDVPTYTRLFFDLFGSGHGKNGDDKQFSITRQSLYLKVYSCEHCQRPTTMNAQTMSSVALLCFMCRRSSQRCIASPALVPPAVDFPVPSIPNDSSGKTRTTARHPVPQIDHFFYSDILSNNSVTGSVVYERVRKTYVHPALSASVNRWETLPHHMVFEVLNFVPTMDVPSFSRVSKAWMLAALNPEYTQNRQRMLKKSLFS